MKLDIIKGILLIIYRKDMEVKNEQMEIIIKEIFNKEKKMDKAFFYFNYYFSV